MNTLRKISGYLGIIGLVFFAFGVLSFVLDIFRGGKISLYPTVNTALGILCIILYIVFNTDAIKRLFGARSTRFGLNAAIYAILFLGILVFVNVIFLTVPTLDARVDLTKNKVFSLADESKQITKKLKTDIKITGFYNVGARERMILKDIIERYRSYSGKISYEFIDADERPDLAKSLEVTNGVIVVESENNRTKLTTPTEQEITNAIKQVTKLEDKYIYFVKGHGEGELESEKEDGISILGKFLQNEGYVAKTINLVKEKEVPADCVTLVIAGPKNSFFPEEIIKVKHYLDNGGTAYILAEPHFNLNKTGFAETGLNELLADLGLSLENNVLMYEQNIPEFLKKLVGRQVGVAAIVNEFVDHRITKKFKEHDITLQFPATRSIKKIGNIPEGVEVKELLKVTGKNSWGETDVTTLSQNKVSKDANDKKPPFTIGYAITKKSKKDPTKEAKVVVLGNASFAQNRYITKMQGNVDFFVNSINWLTGEAEKISIRPKMIQHSKLEWTTEQATVVFYASVLAIPQLILIFGLSVWAWRRKK